MWTAVFTGIIRKISFSSRGFYFPKISVVDTDSFYNPLHPQKQIFKKTNQLVKINAKCIHLNQALRRVTQAHLSSLLRSLWVASHPSNMSLRKGLCLHFVAVLLSSCSVSSAGWEDTEGRHLPLWPALFSFYHPQYLLALGFGASSLLISVARFVGRRAHLCHSVN